MYKFTLSPTHQQWECSLHKHKWQLMLRGCVIETFCNVESQSHFDIHFPLVSAFVSGLSPLCSGLLTGASPAPSSRNFLLIASMAFQISCGLDCVNGEFGTHDLSLFNYSLHFQPCIGGHI